MEKIIFDSWESVVRVALITAMSYVLLIFLLRTFGKRTLSKMNAFDFIVTIALGSTLANVALSKDVALADGATAFLMLIGLQFFITYFSVRIESFRHIIKSQPTLLLYKGKMLQYLMKRERITTDEIRAIVRENGLASIDEAGAVILETDGTLTVLRDVGSHPADSMKGVEMPVGVRQTI